MDPCDLGQKWDAFKQAILRQNRCTFLSHLASNWIGDKVIYQSASGYIEP